MSGARAHQTEQETDLDMALDMDEHPEGASPTPQGSVGRSGQEDPPPRDPQADGRGDDNENLAYNTGATADAVSLGDETKKDKERQQEDGNKKTDNGEGEKQKERIYKSNIKSFNDLFGRKDGKWTRFFNCKVEGRMGAIRFRTETKRMIGSNFSFHRRQDGSFLVDVKTEENAQKFERLERIGNLNIEKSRDIYRNTSQVTVLLTKNLKEEVLEMESEEEDVQKILREALIEEGVPVNKIEYFTRSSRKRQRQISLMFLRITVNSRNPPEEIVLGSELLQCREVKEKPTQCHKCWKFGHPKKYCRGENMCVLCGKRDHNIETCPLKSCKIKNVICINCGEREHTAMSKTCVLYVKEAEIVAIKERTGMTRWSAEQHLRKEGLFQGATYARRTNPERHENEQQKFYDEEQHTQTTQNPSTPEQRSCRPEGSSVPNGTSSPVSTPRTRDLLITKFSTYNYYNNLEDEQSEELEEQEQTKKRKPSPAEEKLSRSTRPRREKGDPKIERENIRAREPRMNEVVPQYLAEALKVAKPWDVEKDKQGDGNEDMETSVGSMEDEQQKEAVTEDELRYFTPRAKFDVYGNEFLSVESAEEEPSEDMIRKPPDKKPPTNISTAPPKRTKARGSDGQHGSEEWCCGCHDCILALLKQEGELKQGKTVSTMLIDLIKKRHKVGRGTGKNRHPEECMCVYHIDEWRNRPWRNRPYESEESTESS